MWWDIKQYLMRLSMIWVHTIKTKCSKHKPPPTFLVLLCSVFATQLSSFHPVVFVTLLHVPQLVAKTCNSQLGTGEEDYRTIQYLFKNTTLRAAIFFRLAAGSYLGSPLTSSSYKMYMSSKLFKKLSKYWKWKKLVIIMVVPVKA